MHGIQLKIGVIIDIWADDDDGNGGGGDGGANMRLAHSQAHSFARI